MRNILWLACAIATTTGCTTSLKSARLDTQPNTPSGLTYLLPAKLFTATAAFEVTGCTPHGVNAEIDARVTATLSESLIGREPYTLDQQKLNNWMKVTGTELKTSPTGLLIGANASITDQTGTLIKDAAVTAATIARAAALPLPPISVLASDGFSNFSASLNSASATLDAGRLLSLDPSLRPEIDAAKKKSAPEKKQAIEKAIEKRTDPCEPILTVLKNKKTAEEAIDKEKITEKSRVAATNSITDAEIEIKALTAMVETYEKLGNDADKSELLKRIKLQEKAKEEAKAKLKVLGESKLEALTKKQSEAKATLALTGTVEFSPDIDDQERKITVKGMELEKLFNGRLGADKIKLPEVSVVIEPLDQRSAIRKMAPPDDAIGIAYRVPAAAFSRIYVQEGKRITLIEKVTQVPQYGPIGSINLDNQVFDDNTMEVAYHADTGAPSRVAYRAKAKSEAIGSAGRDAAGTYLQLQKDKGDDRIAANKALVDQQVLQMTAAKSASDLALTTAQNQATIAKTQASTPVSLLEGEQQRLRAQQQLDAIRTGTATAAEVALEAERVRGDTLAQRLKNLKIEKEIADLMAQQGP